MKTTEYLTADELARRLGLRPDTVRQWARKRRIPAIRLSPKVIRFDLDKVMSFLSSNGKGDGHVA